MSSTKNLQRGTEGWQMWRISSGTMNLIKVLHYIPQYTAFMFCQKMQVVASNG